MNWVYATHQEILLHKNPVISTFLPSCFPHLLYFPLGCAVSVALIQMAYVLPVLVNCNPACA